MTCLFSHWIFIKINGLGEEDGDRREGIKLVVFCSLLSGFY